MKRPIALLVSAGITALILIVVMAVATSTTDSVQANAQQTGTPSALSNDPAVLQQQLQQAYNLLQQRDAAYQQRLQEAYDQIETMQLNSSYNDDDASEGNEPEPEHEDEAGDD